MKSEQVKPPPLSHQAGRNLQRSEVQAGVGRGNKRKPNRDHNIRRCTAPLVDVEEVGVGIIPGDYVVGKCPSSVLGKSSQYEIERRRYK
ncbi:hypothetical protein PHMEG_00027473 [Phytophthora megakarya]|uniref:Uncharacterized protein n=1 Tax=Phytophthora megakarya TaxID=4795 RepID=A0A225V752_9STRA|nr:hypothetical protein PHMEG_00027473 [Phytophthora megakarya]